jgi:hypothetical protein
VGVDQPWRNSRTICSETTLATLTLASRALAFGWLWIAAVNMSTPPPITTRPIVEATKSSTRVKPSSRARRRLSPLSSRSTAQHPALGGDCGAELHSTKFSTS